MKEMNRKIGIGVLWNLANLLLSRGATTIFTLFLARILAPEAFGLVAMATVVFELANAFVQSGLGQALIRSKRISEADLSTVFYANLILSTLAYALLFIGAPYAAQFYHQAELTSLIQVIGLVVFINATKVVQIAVLCRNMNFRTQMQANTIAALGSGVLAVSTAYMGWGVWSLAIMILSQAFLSSLVLWVVSEWRPKAIFSSDSFFRLFRFGRNLLVESMLEVLFQNSYVLVIGRFFSTEVTGLYFFAKKVSNLISQQLTGAIQQATFPALSTLQDENVILRQKYRHIVQLMMFLIAPIMAMLAAMASPLFELLFDEQWQRAVPYLQVLCVVGILYPLHSLNINLLNVKGRSDLVLKIGLLKKAVNLTLLFCAIPFGVFGIAISQVIGSLLALAPNTYYSAKLVNYSLIDQVKDAIIPVFAALVMALFCWWLIPVMDTTSPIALIGIVLGGCIAYVLICLLAGAEGAKFCLSKARSILSASRSAH